MKKFIALFAVVALCFATVFNTSAQVRFAYVDSEYLLSQIPDYEKALKTINDLSIQWQGEIEAKFSEIDQMYKQFQNDAPLLTQEAKNQRENAIIQKEKVAKDLQKKRFGTDGDLFKKREELIRPIQDKIYDAIEKRATSRGYTFVFDRSDNSNILYVDPKSDISNDVLKEMGYTADSKKKPASGGVGN
ncbi:MAG: OmpH family outer membrane protein [Bacteroidales bacterium]|jgi:outer membrane protein|nr:OmpH family outer membrane protein [Bacteroidales bacterium]